MDADDVCALIQDEHHAAEIAVAVRKRGYQSARAAFTADNPRAFVRLMDAAVRYIDALEKERTTRK